MKELVPNKKSRLMPFAQSVQETLDRLDVNSKGKVHITDGCIFEDGKFACVSKGNIVEVVNIKTGLRSSACDFTNKEQKLIVTCVVPCKSLFLVGLRGDSNGMVCIYDPGVSRVMKTIKLPSVPLSMSIIRENGGASAGTSLLSEPLQCMFGIIAVGTEDGHVYLIDMRSDDNGDCSFMPLNTLLHIDTTISGNAPKMRDKARLYGQYCCIDLTSEFLSSTNFKYISPDGNVLKMINKGNCGISSLLYLPQALSLIVGFNFGSFQIWSLRNLQLEYSSAVLPNASSPISHFAFQEPENDPRHCCFLWVGRGPLPAQTESFNQTSISLYQMLYGLKQDVDGYGTLYQQLDLVARRFEHQLTAEAHHATNFSSVGSRIISFKTLETQDTTVCMVVWESPTNNGIVLCHLGIFDLNRFYEKQLPRCIRDAMYGKMEPVCSFFAFYSLTDVAEDFLPGGILDVYLDTKTLQWFHTNVAPQVDKFSWPSSLSFKLTCLSEVGTIEVEMLGMQKKIIADMTKMGTDAFLDVDNLIDSCCVAGLLPYSARQSDDKPNLLLTVALEHFGMIFITSCIKKWAHGSITHAGHSLKLVYDWAWLQVIQRKKLLDDLSTALFDSVVENLEAEQLNQLKTISSQVKDLSEILNELKNSNAISLKEGALELGKRQQVTSHIAMYTDILLLLVDCTLLPERINYAENTKKITYNPTMLAEYYEMHRDSSGNEEDLLIDLMWKEMEFPSDLKDENENDVLYPPPSVEIMCHLYVHNMSGEREKTSCPFYYWFLDVCECYEQLRAKNIQTKFKQLLDLNYSDEMLVKSAWLIDHKLYSEASTQLLMTDVKISSLYYHHIVKLFYKHEEKDLLALFLANKEPNNCCTIEQVKYLIFVLLKMGKLANAYKLQTTVLCPSQQELLFNYFVQQCIQNKQLQRLMMLPLAMEEENMLHNYLLTSKGNEDYLLVYYLERGMFSRAQEVTNKLRAVSTLNLNQVNQEHLQTQCLLVAGFSQLVPGIQQKVNENMEKLSKSMNDAPGSKTPLSSLLIQGDPKNKSPALYSSLFHTNMYDRNAMQRILMNCSTKRRKSPLFETEPVSPKKQKEMDLSVMNMDMTIAESPPSTERRGSYDAANPFTLLSTPVSTKRNFSRISSVGFSKQPQSILKLKPGLSSELMSPVLASSKRIRFVDAGQSPPVVESNLDGSFIASKDPIAKVSFVETKEAPVDGSFVAAKENDESVNASVVSENSSFVSTSSDVADEDEDEDEDLVVPNEKNHSLHTTRDINETLEVASPRIKNILKDLEMYDEEEAPLDKLNSSRPLSMSAEESISEIIGRNCSKSVVHDESDISELEMSSVPSADESAVVEEGKIALDEDNEVSAKANVIPEDVEPITDEAHVAEDSVCDVTTADTEEAAAEVDIEQSKVYDVVEEADSSLMDTTDQFSDTRTDFVDESRLSVDKMVLPQPRFAGIDESAFLSDVSGICSPLPDSSGGVNVMNASQNISFVAEKSINMLSGGLPATPTRDMDSGVPSAVRADIGVHDEGKELFLTPLEEPTRDAESIEVDNSYTEQIAEKPEPAAEQPISVPPARPPTPPTTVEILSDGDEDEEGDEEGEMEDENGSVGSSYDEEEEDGEHMSDSYDDEDEEELEEGEVVGEIGDEDDEGEFSDDKSVVALSSSEEEEDEAPPVDGKIDEENEDDGEVDTSAEFDPITRYEEDKIEDGRFSEKDLRSVYLPSDSGISLDDPSSMKLSGLSQSSESIQNAPVEISKGVPEEDDIVEFEQNDIVCDSSPRIPLQEKESGITLNEMKDEEEEDQMSAEENIQTVDEDDIDIYGDLEPNMPAVAVDNTETEEDSEIQNGTVASDDIDIYGDIEPNILAVAVDNTDTKEDGKIQNGVVAVASDDVTSINEDEETTNVVDSGETSVVQEADDDAVCIVDDDDEEEDDSESDSSSDNEEDEGEEENRIENNESASPRREEDNIKRFRGESEEIIPSDTAKTQQQPTVITQQPFRGAPAAPTDIASHVDPFLDVLEEDHEKEASIKPVVDLDAANHDDFELDTVSVDDVLEADVSIAASETDNKSYYKISFDDDEKVNLPDDDENKDHDMSSVTEVFVADVIATTDEEIAVVSDEIPMDEIVEEDELEKDVEVGATEDRLNEVKDNDEAATDLEMKVCTSEDDGLLADSKRQEPDVNIEENVRQDEAIAPCLPPVEPVVSDDVGVEYASTDYGVESEVIPYMEESRKEVAQAVASPEAKTEETQDKMDWEPNSDDSDSLPKTASGRQPIFVPTRVTEESDKKKHGDSSSSDHDEEEEEEEKSSVITPVRALRRRTVFRKDTLTPRTNKFRVKNTDAASEVTAADYTSSANVSEKDVPVVSDSDGQVFHSRYDSAKNIQEKKKEETDATSTNRRRKQTGRTPSRKTRGSNRRTSESEIAEEEAEHVRTKEIRIGKKKHVENATEYFKADEEEVSSSDDIEIESEDLEIYTGLTRRKPRRTRKSLKSIVSPIPEETMMPKRSSPSKEAEHRTDEVSRDLPKVEEEVADEESEATKRRISVAELPPEKRARLNKSVSGEVSLEDVENEIDVAKKEDGEEDKDESSDESEYESPPAPRQTRGQMRSTVRQTRSHGPSKSSTRNSNSKKSGSKSGGKSGGKSHKKKSPSTKSTPLKLPDDANEHVTSDVKSDNELPKLVLSCKAFSVRKLNEENEESKGGDTKKIPKEEERNTEEMEAEEETKNGNKSRSSSEDTDVSIPRTTRARRGQSQTRELPARRGGKSSGNDREEECVPVTSARTKKSHLQATIDENVSTIEERFSALDTAEEPAVDTPARRGRGRPRKVVETGRQTTQSTQNDESLIDSTQNETLNTTTSSTTIPSADKTIPNAVTTTRRTRTRTNTDNSVDENAADENISSIDERVSAIDSATDDSSIISTKTTRSTRGGRRGGAATETNKSNNNETIDDRVSPDEPLSDESLNATVSTRRTRTTRTKKGGRSPAKKNDSSADERVSTLGAALEESLNITKKKYPLRDSRGHFRSPTDVTTQQSKEKTTTVVNALNISTSRRGTRTSRSQKNTLDSIPDLQQESSEVKTKNQKSKEDEKEEARVEEKNEDNSDEQEGSSYLKRFRNTTRNTRRATYRHSAAVTAKTAVSANKSELADNSGFSESAIDESSQDEDDDTDAPTTDTLTHVRSPSQSESVKDDTTDASPVKNTRQTATTRTRTTSRRGASKKDASESDISSTASEIQNTSRASRSSTRNTTLATKAVAAATRSTRKRKTVK